MLPLLHFKVLIDVLYILWAEAVEVRGLDTVAGRELVIYGRHGDHGSTQVLNKSPS